MQLSDPVFDCITERSSVYTDKTCIINSVSELDSRSRDVKPCNFLNAGHAGYCTLEAQQRNGAAVVTSILIIERKPNDGLKARADQVLHAERVDTVELRACLLQTIIELGEPGSSWCVIANLNKSDGQIGVVPHVLSGRIDNDLLDLSLVARLAVRNDENGLGATRARLPMIRLDRICKDLRVGPETEGEQAYSNVLRNMKWNARIGLISRSREFASAYLGQLGAAAGLGLVKQSQNVVGALHALVLLKLAVEKVQRDAVRVAARDARYQVLERGACLANLPACTHMHITQH